MLKWYSLYLGLIRYIIKLNFTCIFFFLMWLLGTVQLHMWLISVVCIAFRLDSSAFL